MGLAQDVLVVAGLAGVAIAGLFFIIRGAGQALEGFTLPEIKLPDINIGLPSLGGITLPSLPSFELPSFELPSFELPSFEDVFMVPAPVVEPEREDVPFGEDEQIIDIVPDVTGGRGERLRGVIPPREDIPELVSVTREPFDIIEETQAEFQERAGLFVEALPEVTAFTSLPGSVTDFVRRQLSRESEDFESVLAAEARRSETIFAGLFGNVQNPEFGA